MKPPMKHELFSSKLFHVPRFCSDRSLAVSAIRASVCFTFLQTTSVILKFIAHLASFHPRSVSVALVSLASRSHNRRHRSNVAKPHESNGHDTFDCQTTGVLIRSLGHISGYDLMVAVGSKLQLPLAGVAQK